MRALKPARIFLRNSTEWYAEISIDRLRTLPLNREKLRSLRAEVRSLKKRRRELVLELKELGDYCRRLTRANDELMERMELQPHHRQIMGLTRSPKNYFNAADDHAFTPSRGGVQGGSGGLEKK